MRDFRFHVASLIAVFLALGVGMLLGYSVALELQAEPLKSQIISVQKQNSSVSDENKDLRDSNQELARDKVHSQNEINRLAELSVAGRLSGRSVSLVVVGAVPSPAILDQMWRTLLTAGAVRLNETLIRGSLVPLGDKSAQEILTRIHAASDDDPGSAIAEALASAIGTGSDPSFPAALIHRGVPIDTSGSYDHRPDLVILFSDVESPERLRDIQSGDTPETPLVQAFQDRGIRVVECETSSSTQTASSYFRRLGISSVDNVETVEGQVSLVWASLGYAGHYGSRSSADKLLPGSSPG